MIPVIETKDGFESIGGNPTLLSLDGNERAPLAVLMHPSWSDEDRARFGVYIVEPAQIPDGKEPIGMPRYERDKAGKLVQVRELVDLPQPVVLTPKERLDHLLGSVGLTLDELKDLIK